MLHFGYTFDKTSVLLTTYFAYVTMIAIKMKGETL